MTILISAVIAVLSAQPALAQRRANRPFNTPNGRTATAAPAAPRVYRVTTPGGGAAANNVSSRGTASGGAQAFMGGGRRSVTNSSGRAVRRSGGTFWGSSVRKETGDAPTSTEEAPPNFSKPGALIRTTGQQPQYEKVETRTHTTDAGEIVLNEHKARNSNRAPSLHHGPKDTLPPPNPGTGGSNYGTGAAANSPSTDASSGSNGHDNNGSGNNDKNMPGDSTDQQGGDNGMAQSFYNAY